MAIFTKAKLSQSTDGKGILVTATASAGTLIHTAVAGTSSFDSITILAVNTSASSVKLTLQWGGTTSPDNDIEFTVPAESGLYPIVVNQLLQNTMVVRAWAATGSVIVLYGDVTQIV